MKRLGKAILKTNYKKSIVFLKKIKNFFRYKNGITNKRFYKHKNHWK